MLVDHEEGEARAREGGVCPVRVVCHDVYALVGR